LVYALLAARRGQLVSGYHGEGVGVGLALAALSPGPILSSSPSSVPFTFL